MPDQNCPQSFLLPRIDSKYEKVRISAEHAKPLCDRFRFALKNFSFSTSRLGIKRLNSKSLIPTVAELANIKICVRELSFIVNVARPEVSTTGVETQRSQRERKSEKSCSGGTEGGSRGRIIYEFCP